MAYKKFTHEEFLIKLKEKNDYYKSGFFEVLDTYQNKRVKIKVKTPYGICEMYTTSLLKNNKPNIQSAINKTDYFISMCIDKFGIENNDDLSQVIYINKYEKIKVIDKDFGEYYVRPWIYYGGTRSQASFNKRVSIINSKFTKDSIKEELLKIHPNIEILSEYVNLDTEILIKDKYSTYKVTPKHLLKSKKPSFISAIDKNKCFINRCKEIYGDIYDYSLVNYVNHQTKVKIKSKYGVFEVTPNSHLRGSGCPILAKETRSKKRRINPPSWDYTNWEKAGKKSKRFDSYKVYFIKCWDENETFYKIGKTYLTLKQRFYGLPYKYEVLHFIASKSSLDISKLEAELKNKNKEHKYVPKKEFGGRYECFSQLQKINYDKKYI